ncbi:MAG: YkgJ family cysteine cluster protein [Salinivirgaceae bacterium]
MDKNLIEDYYKLRNEIDAASEGLEKKHKNQMACKKGCSMCCESLRLFPLELAAIRQELGEYIQQLPKKRFRLNPKACRFLVNDICTIYASRPIICRTQGLPLLYENKQGTGFEFSTCRLNFKEVTIQSFNNANALFMSPFNSRLFLMNQQYIKQLNNSKLSSVSRFKLNDLGSLTVLK